MLNVDRLKCGAKATGTCLVRCSTIKFSPIPPFATPTLDAKCLKPCIESEFTKCLNRLAIAIASK
jgi:hypothetical protein